MLQNADEGLLRVRLAVEREQVGFGDRLFERHVARREDPARHRREVRSEVHRDGAAGLRERLLHFGGVPVFPQFVGFDVLVDLGKVRRGGRASSRARDARLRVHDDCTADASAGEEGEEGERRRGRIATGVGDEPRRAHLLPVDFGQAVDRLGQQFRRSMIRAVPLRVSRRVFQAEVGTEIDYPRFPFEECRNRFDRGAVRKREKDDVRVLRHPPPAGAVQQVVAETAQVREDVSQRPTLLPEGRQVRDLHGRVAREPADELSPCIPRRSGHARANPFHLHIYTKQWI